MFGKKVKNSEFPKTDELIKKLTKIVEKLNELIADGEKIVDLCDKQREKLRNL
jgi:hypothetical protein